MKTRDFDSNASTLQMNDPIGFRRVSKQHPGFHTASKMLEQVANDVLLEPPLFDIHAQCSLSRTVGVA
jgi:hypothetical protein